jgi:hypothetical protein
MEILKWPLGKRKNDNSKGLAHFVFGDSEDLSEEKHLFYRESIISAKTTREKKVVWIAFVLCLVFLVLSIYSLFFD